MLKKKLSWIYNSKYHLEDFLENFTIKMVKIRKFYFNRALKNAQAKLKAQQQQQQQQQDVSNSSKIYFIYMNR